MFKAIEQEHEAGLLTLDRTLVGYGGAVTGVEVNLHY